MVQVSQPLPLVEVLMNSEIMNSEINIPKQAKMLMNATAASWCDRSETDSQHVVTGAGSPH